MFSELLVTPNRERTYESQHPRQRSNTTVVRLP